MCAFEPLFRLMASSIWNDSSSRTASMSYRAITLSSSAGVIMLSPSTFLAKTVDPAPMNVIFGITLPPLSFLLLFPVIIGPHSDNPPEHLL